MIESNSIIAFLILKKKKKDLLIWQPIICYVTTIDVKKQQDCNFESWHVPVK